jgi:hypothetical protein
VQLQQLPEIFGQTTFEDHFKAPGDGEPEMSSFELDTYTMCLSLHHRCVEKIRKRSSAFKDSHMTVYLVDPALTDDDEPWLYNKSVRLIMVDVAHVPFIRNVAWVPLLLQGTFADVGNDEHLCTFRPHSDFSFAKATYGPLILGEIVLDKDAELDRWRMLFEGIAVCRYQNIIRGDREAIILCLYLNKDYKMERYLVYQDADTKTRDVSVLLSTLSCQPD